MTISRKLTLAAMLVMDSANATSPPTTDLTANGLGKIQIGMRIEQVNHTLAHPIVPNKVALRASATCDYNPLPDFPGVSLLFNDKVLTRIDVETNKFQFPPGITVGDLQAYVEKKVPHAKREPLDHVPDGMSYVLEDAQSPNGVSLQFEHGKLARIIVGDKRKLRIAEGCM